MLICDECGAYVADSIKHAAFHDKLHAVFTVIAEHLETEHYYNVVNAAQELRGAKLTSKELNEQVICKACGYDKRLLPHEKQVDCPECAYGWRVG